MLHHKTRLTFIIATAVLIISVLGFTGGLNIASFKKSYTNSLVAGYVVVGNEYINKIEYALKYGKPLDNFYGLQEMLQEAKLNTQDLKEIRTILNNGRIVASVANPNPQSSVPSELVAKLTERQSLAQTSNIYLPYHGDIHIFLPIHDRQRHRIGSMNMVFSEAIVKSRTNTYLKQILLDSALLFLIALAALIIFMYKFQIVTESGIIKRRVFLVFILIVLTFIQLTFGFINFNLFKKVYNEVAKEYTSKTAVIIQKDINQIVRKGVNYSDFHDIEAWLERFIVSAPEIGKIYIVDQQNRSLFSTSSSIDDSLENAEYTYSLPLATDSNHTAAVLRISLSQKYINGKLTAIALDTITVLIIAFFFMVELTLLLMIFLNQSAKNLLQNEQQSTEAENIQLIRPLGFIFYFSAFLSMSFIPIVMKDFYRPIPGISQNVILGLPLSAELIFGALAALPAGYLIEKWGWKPVFFFGLSFFISGILLSAIATVAPLFILARAIYGTGYGFCLLAMYGFVNTSSTSELKNEGISILNAGAYAGLNCGCVIGAMIAERAGYATVFFIAFPIAIIAGIFVYFSMKNRKIGAVRVQNLRTNKIGVLSFLSDFKVLTFLALVTLPVAICSMFLEFFLPLFSRTIGVSASDTGRVFLVNGIAIVYLGPIFCKYIGERLGIQRSTILAVGMVAIAMLVFAWWGNFIAAIIAAFILGIAMGFGDAAQNNHLLSFQATTSIGEGKAIGFFNVISKIGQGIGPVIFGILMSFGVSGGVGIIGLSLTGCLILFILLSYRRFNTVK